MHAKNKLVSFIGLGSGSVSELLYKYIRLHPEVCIPEDETNFFSDTKKYAKGVSWYEDILGGLESGNKCGELATGYLRNMQSASLIARTYPDAKLFAVVENPLLNVRIAYVEEVRTKKISSETTLGVFIKQNPEVLTQSLYGRQLVHYFDYYSQNDLLVLVAGDVRENSLTAISSIFNYIEVDPTFIPVELKSLVPSEDSEIKKIGLIKRTVRRVYKSTINLFNYCKNFVRPPSKPIETSINVAEKIRMSPELEAYLKDYFRKDVKQLSALLHRDFNEEWGI